MLSQGDIYREWVRTRRVWVAQNPPDHSGYYVCAICGKAVHESEMELDHIKARSRRPDLRSELSNLQPTHSWCNRQKGSRGITPFVSPEEYELRRLLDL